MAAIQRNDLPRITASSRNPNASTIFNPPVAASPGVPKRYIVSREGEIRFPGFDSTRYAGLGKKQFKKTIYYSLGNVLGAD